MPTTKKESVYFGLMMCFGMVLFMTSYHLWTNGLLGMISLKELLIQFIQVFMIAFLLESFIVGPIAKKIAFALPYDKSKKGLVILSMAFFMVCGMVLFMSLYGLGTAYYFHSIDGESLLASYFSMVCKNFVFAFPLQLLIVGPIVRYLFARFVQRKAITIRRFS
ncbi:hypothetical protein [Brevibacillus reuszeri]|uniref:hypothetical protein n=1 Tax=Brevibacillus reuszeri TaxID=54915 RepID=UPI000CCC8010|nr:hypothetical protein [Brevibacillus reuszeri]